MRMSSKRWKCGESFYNERDLRKAKDRMQYELSQNKKSEYDVRLDGVEVLE